MMEKRLEYVLQLSLKQMALRRSAVLLWNESDTLRSIMKFTPHECFVDEGRAQWREEVEKNVRLKVSELKLPNSLKKLVMDEIRPVGLQIRAWKRSFEAYVGDSSHKIRGPFLTKLCWSSTGTIDYRKTAVQLVHSDILSLEQRYKLACLYCLEEDIPLLWEELSEKTKEHFCNEKGHPPFLHSCWPHILKGELSGLDYVLDTNQREHTSFNQFAFELSATDGNKAAAEYFFQKLTEEERSVSMKRTAVVVIAKRLLLSPNSNFPAPELSNVLCYLLSVMTPEQRVEVVKSQPVCFWLCFFSWPWQDLFAKNADLMWAEIDPTRYEGLALKMSYEIRSTDHYPPKVFREFFLRSPVGFKKCFVTEMHRSGVTPAAAFLHYFFRSDDSETIEVVFRNIPAAVRSRVLLHGDVLHLFYLHILKERWRLVKVCLREAELSKEDKGRLKDAFIVFLRRNNSRRRIDLADRKWERFFELLN